MILIDPPAVARWDPRGSHQASDTSKHQVPPIAPPHGVPARGWDRDHYDVPADAYDALVAAGAVPVTSREIVVALRAAGLRRPKARFRDQG